VINGGTGQIIRQKAAGLVDGGLHLLLGHVQAHVQNKLQRNDRSPAGTLGRHAAQARHLAKLLLQGSGYPGGDHLGAGARIQGDHLDGGIVDFRQGGNGQVAVRQEPGQQQGQHEERGGYRTKDEQA
jgi:hypothetical protein